MKTNKKYTIINNIPLLAKGWHKMSTLPEEMLLHLDKYSLLDVNEGFKILKDWPLFYSIAEIFPLEGAKNITYLTEVYNIKDWIKIEDMTNNIEISALYLGALRLQKACKYFISYHKMGMEIGLDKLYDQLIKVNNQTIDKVATWLYVHGDDEKQLS